MKRFLRIIFVALGAFALIAGAVAWLQRDSLRESLNEWQKEREHNALINAIQTQVKQLPAVDEVVVMRLKYEPQFPGQEPFGKVDANNKLYEVKSVILKGRDAQSFTELWRSQIVIEDGASCHIPHHALRFLMEGRQISSAKICFLCMNAAIPCGSSTEDLIGFDFSSPEYTKLKEKIEGLVGAESKETMTAP